MDLAPASALESASPAQHRRVEHWLRLLLFTVAPFAYVVYQAHQALGYWGSALVYAIMVTLMVRYPVYLIFRLCVRGARASWLEWRRDRAPASLFVAVWFLLATGLTGTMVVMASLFVARS